MDELEHPFKDEIQRLRACILAVDPSIAEGIKWKAPSFRTSEYFATTNLRAKGATGVILHLGAKVRDAPPGGVKIKDPDGLLKWLAGDRAMVEFKTGQDLEDHAESFQALIRQWIRYL
ncbi:DUF1801 domain-containing protein [Dokdonella sp.]|uniref:DUF1801 domain-containing protein n=1 Tax=Dokdonella sp. TaxID=2291710 RepID=UPI003527F28B